MNEEIKSFYNNRTWKLVKPPQALNLFIIIEHGSLLNHHKPKSLLGVNGFTRGKMEF